MQLEPVLIRNEIFTMSRNYAIDLTRYRHHVSRALNTIIGAESTPLIFAIQFRKLQMLILFLIVELY